MNYDACIKYFLENDKYSANLIRLVASKHKNFMEIVNAVLGKNYTLEELLKKYKRRYVDNKIISSTTVLYRSNAFSGTLGIIEENENRPEIDTTQKSEEMTLVLVAAAKNIKNAAEQMHIHIKKND